MKRWNRPLLFALAFACGQASGHGRDDYEGLAIQSLNTPDPIFVSTDNVAVRVTANKSSALRKARVLLNGDDVTSAFAAVSDEEMTGTLAGLKPGINRLEVLKNRGDREPAAQLKVARARPPSVACAASSFPAAVLPVPNTAVTSATLVAATPTVPEHCLVTGTIDAGRIGYETRPGAPTALYTYSINWASRLPTAWNSKFFMPGGGGTNGAVPNTTTNLSRGYSTAANDSGHSNAVNNDPLASGTGSFGTDYQARVNFAYRAIDVTTQTGKALAGIYYGDRPAYSYFQGCSMGGREAMMVTEKLPHHFDGSISGDPGFKFIDMSIHAVYDGQLLAQLASSMGLVSVNGLPLTNNTFTNQDLQLISKAVLDACDTLDGLADGMVGNFHQCTTERVAPKLDALQCVGSKTDTCLMPGQIDAIRKIYAGPPTRKPNGRRAYYGWMWDAGIAGCNSPTDCNVPGATNIHTNWRGWKIGQFQANPATAVNSASDFTADRGGALTTTIAPTPPIPVPVANEGPFANLLGYDLEEYAARIYSHTPEFPISSAELLNVDSPDRTVYKRHGGKLIVTQPQSGGPFSPLAMVDWYQKLNRFEGGDSRDYEPAQKFARLFMQPGAHHCGNGPSTSVFDAFPSIVDWVENGNAPESIQSTAPANTPWPGRTRPLCPYPSYAKYKGAGDVNLAENFECHTDKPHGNRHHGHDDDDAHHGHR